MIRVLLAMDVLGNLMILSTDSTLVAWEADRLGSSFALDLGLVSHGCETMEPGLYLWEGSSRKYYSVTEKAEEIKYEGKLTPLVLATEVKVLYEMSPPEQEDS